MLRNSSQFFRMSNTREDFHTSTRRCSKLFAFLGPAKPGKMRIWNMFERSQTRIDGIRNHVGWRKSVDFVCLLSWRRWSGHLSTCCNIVTNAIITYVVIYRQLIGSCHKKHTARLPRHGAFNSENSRLWWSCGRGGGPRFHSRRLDFVILFVV